MSENKSTPSPPATERDYQRVVNSWAMFDWANSAFAVIILTAIFPVYYRALVTNAGRSPEDATAYWAYTTSASLLVVAVVGPVLGAAADITGGRKRSLAAALAFGVLGSTGLSFLGKDTFVLGSLVFALGNLGFTGGNIFYEALLPHIARPDDLNRVSARGYALGYLGGGLLLVINALWLYRPDWFWLPDREFALRASFVSVAVWWLVFALPLFRNVAEPDGRELARLSARVVIDGWRRLRRTLKQIRRYRQLAVFLAAFWLYNDGVSTIIKMAAAYGDEIGIGHNDMLIALILTQFIGFPSTLGFGAFTGILGTKRAILLGLACYMLVTIGGFFIKSALHFYLLAVVVGLVQGGTQALSRSLFTSMVPKTQSAEFFGFFSTGEKLAGIIGPALFGLVGQLTGSSRWGIISVVFLFVAGALLLWQVDEEEGRRAAGTAENIP
ncbi:MAG: MFS transporter [Deltaproteobacteria bacterium]|nr:MFS transporter [Deltaproteobacteria bacterium]